MKKIIFLIFTIVVFSCKNDSDSDSIAGKKRFNGTVTSKVIDVNGELPENFVNSASRIVNPHGYRPNICYYANSDNSVDIAWLDESSNNKIKLTRVDNQGGKIETITLKFTLPSNGAAMPGIGKLLGVTKITEDNGFAIAYSSNVLHPSEVMNQEYWIARFDASGKQLFNKMVFGQLKREAPYKILIFNPGVSSTGRLAYNEIDKTIAYYVGAHQLMGPNPKNHQGSTIGTVSINPSNPENIVFKRWHASHDYNQRVLIDGKNYLFFGHGDRFPRALHMSSWSLPRKNNFINKQGEYFSYGGWKNTKRNNLQFGGVTKLNDGSFGVVYAQGINKFVYPKMGTRNVYYRKVSADGKSLTTKKLTTGLEEVKENAGFTKIAQLGDNIIIAWHNSNIKEKPYAFIGEFDTNGNTITEPKMIDKVLLQPQYDMINLPNGDVFWVSINNKNRSKLILNYIKKN